MRRNKPLVPDRTGAITLPLALLLVCALFATLGAWSLLRHERNAEKLELGILNCIGYRAQLFRNLQNEIEASNAAIRSTRAAIAASALLPAGLPELILALNTAVSLQEISLAAYQTQSLAWRLAPACQSEARYGSSEAPKNAPWQRPPPDPIGQQALEPTHPRGEAYDFSVHSRSGRIQRSAHARVVFDPLRDRWTSHWGSTKRTRPNIPIGAISP